MRTGAGATARPGARYRLRSPRWPLNAIAPGRVVCGIGTGNTARRTLGMLPTKMAELEAFTAAPQALTAGNETAYTEGERTRTIRFVHVGPYVSTADPVEFVVAAFGLKAAAIAGRRGTASSPSARSPRRRGRRSMPRARRPRVRPGVTPSASPSSRAHGP